MVGHTHEDIDSCFRVIMEEMTRRGFIGTIDPHVELLEAVADYKAWVAGHVWELSTADDDVGQVNGLNSARCASTGSNPAAPALTLPWAHTFRPDHPPLNPTDFVIERRARDGVVCFWSARASPLKPRP